MGRTTGRGPQEFVDPIRDRDERAAIVAEIARLAAHYVVAAEEGVPAAELPPLRSAVGALGSGRWRRLVRHSEKALIENRRRGGHPTLCDGDYRRIGAKAAARLRRERPRRPADAGRAS